MLKEFNLYVKNVGQGDTLLVDWDCENGKKYGLIDCNLVDGEIKSLIEHIEFSEIKEFDFVVMSHPHSDHFSGFPLFFDYCKSRNILINKFIHSCSYDPDFLKSMLNPKLTKKEFKRKSLASTNFIEHKKKLRKIFDYLILESEKKGTRFISEILDATGIIPLCENIYLEFLSPLRYHEVRDYLHYAFSAESDEKLKLSQERENNPYANILSTFIKIGCPKEEWRIFLTSDSTTYTFERIFGNASLYKKIAEGKTFLIQIPHHGSKNNHVELFWKNLNKTKTIHSFISVGDGYGHPSEKVISFFDDLYCSVHSTNFVGGYKDHYTKKDTASEKNHLFLDIPGVTMNIGNVNDINPEKYPTCCEKHFRIEYENGIPALTVKDIRTNEYQ